MFDRPTTHEIVENRKLIVSDMESSDYFGNRSQLSVIVNSLQSIRRFQIIPDSRT